jgi:hypothetical protein
MAYGAEGYALPGECLRRMESNKKPCVPLRELTVHTRFSSPFTIDYNGTMSCGKQYQGISDDLTQIVGFKELLTTVHSGGALYGRRPVGIIDPESAVDPDAKTLDGVWFNDADLATWKPRKVDMFTTGSKAVGPALTQFHMATPIRRRLRGVQGANNKNYVNRYNYDFAPAALTIFSQTDWLGQLHPAMYFWTNTNVPEPFAATDYYEQSGASPVTDPQYHTLTAPFCPASKIPFRDASGNILGHYVGFTAIHLFSLAFVHHADAMQLQCNKDGTITFTNPFLPENYHKPADGNNKRPKVVHSNQFFSLQSNIFLVAKPVNQNTVVKSPLVGSVHWWHYGDPTTQPWACDKYIAVNMAPIPRWRIDIKFPLVGGGATTLRVGLSMLSTYVSS